MQYNRLLAMPWDGLSLDQQAQSLSAAYLAGNEIGTDQAQNHNNTAPTTFDDFDLLVLGEDEFNETAGDDAPTFQNTWKENYWPSAGNDLRVLVFISACDAAKQALGN